MSTSKMIKVAAWTVVIFHVAVLWRTGTVGGGSLLSNIAQLTAAGLAAASCLLAARRLTGFARRFWFLMAMSFSIWTIAQAGWIYSEDVLHQAVPTIFWINVFFFFFVAPMGLALLLPPDIDSADKRWTFYLDVAQLAIIVITAYLYFVIPSLWYGRGLELNREIRISSEWRNYILLVAFILRVALAPSAKMKPFKQMAIVLAVYSVVESFYFHLTRVAVINTGLWFDLGWSVPFAMAAVFAANSSEQATELATPQGRALPWQTTLVFHVIPLLTPIFVIALAARIVAQQLVVAAISVAASVLVAVARVFVADFSRERATAALKEAEERYRLLFIGNPHPMYVLDFETTAVLEVNQAAIDKYGYSREEFLTKRAADIRSPEEAAELENDRARILAGAGSRELMHRNKDRHIFPVAATASLIHIGGRRAVIVLAEDISERKRAEESLRKSRQMLSLHIQQTPLGFIEWNVDHQIVEWNPSAEDIFGYSKAEVLGKDYRLLIPPSEREKIIALHHAMLVGKVGTRSTNENLTKSGKKIICEWYNTSLMDVSGQILGTASLVQDVTEQRNLEEKLRQSQKMEAIGTLAGGVAHDFNNLLTVIGGYTSLVQHRFKEEGKAAGELQEVIDATGRAATLTSQLLTFSRKQVTQTVVLDVNESVTRMEKMLGRVIGEDIKLETDLATDLYAIKADSGQIDQVIMNLAVNARDAMPKGGSLRFSTCNVTSAHPHCPLHDSGDPFALLTATDTGCGMDAATIEHIFEPFFTTKKGKGTGLGLSTVYGIVESAGGAISVESKPDAGSSFYVFFPAVNKAPLLQQRRRTTGVGGGLETILLVEDERSVRELASVILRRYGYNVLVADSGAQAEALSHEFSQRIDLLITDVVMPGLNGPETSQRLRVHRPELRVLYTSGYTDNELTRTTLGLDNKVFLQKPFSPEALAAKVREVLDGTSAKAPARV